MKIKKYYRCGFAPYTVFGPIFNDKKECTERAKEENKYGEYKGRGVKVYQVDENGKIKMINNQKNPPEDIRPSVQHELKIIGKQGPRINQPRELASFLHPYLTGADREYVLVAILNNKNVVLAVDVASKGILNASLIHPREVFKAAIVKSAAAIITAHNHPSGDPNPSSEDRETFDRLVKAGETIGIRCLDMLVLGEDRFFSIYSNESGSY